jgi:hypothetical protein
MTAARKAVPLMLLWRRILNSSDPVIDKAHEITGFAERLCAPHLASGPKRALKAVVVELQVGLTRLSVRQFKRRQLLALDGVERIAAAAARGAIL